MPKAKAKRKARPRPDPSLREQLAPLIAAVGLRETSRRSGVDASSISTWLSQSIPSGRTEPRRMSDVNVEAIAKAVGARIRIEVKS